MGKFSPLFPMTCVCFLIERQARRERSRTSQRNAESSPSAEDTKQGDEGRFTREKGKDTFQTRDATRSDRAKQKRSV